MQLFAYASIRYFTNIFGGIDDNITKYKSFEVALYLIEVRKIIKVILARNAMGILAFISSTYCSTFFEIVGTFLLTT